MAKGEVSSWHIGVAAEAFAAGLFARCGLDVSVQYGANQPEYDLIVVQGSKIMKVSVKGSQDGSWGLTQGYLKDAQYHRAADSWLAAHKEGTIFCFMQFKNVGILELPRVYLPTPFEVCARLKSTANGRGDTILYEHHVWTKRAKAFGSIESIPAEWQFSKQRVGVLLARTS